MKLWYVYSHGGFIGTIEAATKGAALRKARAHWLESDNITVRGNPARKKSHLNAAKKRAKGRAAHALLRQMNPAGSMKKIGAVRIKRLKGGGVSIIPIKKAVKR